MSLTDERLCEKIRAGDLQAFDLLYERYERNLFSFLFRYLNNRQDAEEVFHEAFLALLRSPPSTFEQGNFRSWIYQVARNKALNRLRHKARDLRAKEANEQDESLSRSESDEGFMETEKSMALAGAVARLPLTLAEIYGLRASGLRYEEMAEVLNIPVGTVRSRMHEMVKRLKKEMEAWIAA